MARSDRNTIRALKAPDLYPPKRRREGHLTAGRGPDDTRTIDWLDEYMAAPARWDEPMPWMDAADPATPAGA